MNGAEPSEYYLGNFGSNVKMALDSYEQVSQGMSSVLARFENSVEVKLGAHVRQIILGAGMARTGAGRVSGAEIVFTQEGEEKALATDHVVVATPAPVAADLLGACLPELVPSLRQIRYYPVAVAIVKYRRNVFRPSVRGLIFDESFAVSNAGAYGLNDLDLVRFTFSGQEARASVNEETDPRDAIALAEKVLNPHFAVSAGDREEFAYRYFKNGLCGYSAFHHRQLREIREIVERHPALSLCGDYFRGASIEACFRSGQEAAARAQAQI
jgi:protoporphyrinogen/coproporphyrinogen III oxidase